MNYYVMVEGEFVLVDYIMIDNIEEDIQGYDVVYFRYKGKSYTSKVFRR